MSGIEDPFHPTDPFNIPPAGSRFVAIRLRITNVSEQTRTIQPATDFEVVGKLGVSYDVAVVVGEPADISAGGPDLGVMPPRASIEGLLPFQIPLSDAPARLRLRRADSYIEIELTRTERPSSPIPSAP